MVLAANPPSQEVLRSVRDARQGVAEVYETWPFDTEVEDASLRTAVALLATTTQSEQVRDLLTAPDHFVSVFFEDLPAHQAAASRGLPGISINSRYRNEHPVLLAAQIAHEMLHQDDVTGRAEEVAALVFEVMVFAELLSDNPSLVEEQTELMRRELTSLLAVVFNADTITGEGQLIPGQAEPVSVYGLLPYAERQTEGNDLWSVILGRNSSASSTPKFDRTELSRLQIRDLLPASVDLEALADAMALKPIP